MRLGNYISYYLIAGISIFILSCAYTEEEDLFKRDTIAATDSDSTIADSSRDETSKNDSSIPDEDEFLDESDAGNDTVSDGNTDSFSEGEPDMDSSIPDGVIDDMVDEIEDSTPDEDGASGEVTLISIYPENGLKEGGAPITIKGTGFTSSTSVKFGSSEASQITMVDSGTITCKTPSSGSGAGMIAVTVSNGGSFEDTKQDFFKYTGNGTTLGWCKIMSSSTFSVTAGSASESIYSQVYKSGVTEAAGQGSGISGEVGFGPKGTDPNTNAEWLWFESAYNPSCSNCGNNDEYSGEITAPNTAGAYSFAFRFSDDSGLNFLYCDTVGVKNGESLSTASLGSMTTN